MFVVLSATAIPEHLRGYLSRFLSEASAGLYVGNVSKRVQENLWARCLLASCEGSFTMITSNRNTEQGFTIQSIGEQSRPVLELDGLTLTYLPVPKNSENSKFS
ncbi:MAG: type I-E CRISPR-associated endoribonuclease Cas2e [Rothia sp. (in: high G+C Gram-positive bacteria)]|nr:type I-E CRISPR-associated endoribonuclease Cas2e [Rothia sp. (in: high G+C Gram-positive bacteria)]